LLKVGSGEKMAQLVTLGIPFPSFQSPQNHNCRFLVVRSCGRVWFVAKKEFGWDAVWWRSGGIVGEWEIIAQLEGSLYVVKRGEKSGGLWLGWSHCGAASRAKRSTAGFDLGHRAENRVVPAYRRAELVVLRFGVTHLVKFSR